MKKFPSEDDYTKGLFKRYFLRRINTSGYQEIDEEDTCITKCGSNLLIDPLSFQYLVCSTIDYSEDLAGSKFIVKNPNATTTCGCGESFSI